MAKPAETNILANLEEEEVLYMIVQVFTAEMDGGKNVCLICRRYPKNSKKGRMLLLVLSCQNRRL